MNRHKRILQTGLTNGTRGQRISESTPPKEHRGWRCFAAIPWGLLSVVLLVGCHTPKVSHEAKMGPVYDRPFPLGQVTDAHWETMQTNAEAADFIFYDHEFVGQTADLTPLGRKHLLSVALRLEHVPFPVVVEESPRGENPQLDEARRQTIVNQLVQLGLNREMVEARVVVAPAFTEGLSAIEGEAAYYSTLLDSQYGTGFRGMNRGFSGWRR
ncbi:hypothetical protein THTE_4206 [Thermogutta terrifontis]|jgi:hypothetical protein|uniref:Uncharacterized protein n=1 Tax=Thermogutta terrifontis TaxID=1331910 RepID=A0A286RLM7_9BACT|nr:hypothetical protein [Thermogutta terrifontis]ASV76807.1 hypothetical protein THTE_4206 [Thermogutta terrifontis]